MSKCNHIGFCSHCTEQYRTLERQLSELQGKVVPVDLFMEKCEENAELRHELSEVQAENEKLELRATAVVKDAHLLTSKKPDATDCYGVNAVLLWRLLKELEGEI